MSGSEVSESRAFRSPAWLERLAVNDSLFERAYEQTDPRLRACLKTGIALTYFHLGISSETVSQTRSSARLGFIEESNVRSLDWSVLVFGPGEKAAARICALALLPQLFGCPITLAICLEREPDPALLVSLELCGIEDVFVMDASQCPNLLSGLTKNGPGCVCLLHNGQLNSLYERIAASNLRTMNLDRRPSLLLETPEAFEMDVLKFCQGEDIQLKAEPDYIYDCVYTDRKAVIPSRLTLGPGCEGFWLFDNLDPAFFLSRRYLMRLQDSP